MCAVSKCTLNGKPVWVIMGYYGSFLSVGDVKYGDYELEEANTDEAGMIALLSSYSSAELARLLVELVRDGVED